MHSSPLLRIAGAFAELVRWGEPWDVEDDDDPLLDRTGMSESASLWA